MCKTTCYRISLAIVFIAFLSFAGYCQEEEIQTGLFFSSHEVVQDKRTALKITPEKPFKTRNGFSLDFDSKFRKGDGYYGYIFRVICNDEINIDLVSNLASASANFWLVYKDQILFTIKWEDIPQGEFDKWINIKFTINPVNKSLYLSFNGKEFHSVEPEIENLSEFNIVFGAFRDPNFTSTDVSPMSLKELKVVDSKNQLINYWKLSKHRNVYVLDEVSKKVAVVENPTWIIDRHVRWKKLLDIKMDSVFGITSDMKAGNIFLVGDKAIYTLNSETFRTDTTWYKSGTPYHSSNRQIIFHPASGEIWSYDFDNPEISKFNFNTKEWSSNQFATKEPDYWHHNKVISPVDGSLITLFGYGHYLYKSVINLHSDSGKSWIQMDKSDQIEPRYLSSAGIIDNQTALVFGGYGSKSGRQELSPKFFYDLHFLSFSNYSFKKQWEIQNYESPLVPCEALIPDVANSCFYTLMYNRLNYSTDLRLARVSIDEPVIQLYNDSIPYKFLDTESWSTLMLNRKTSELIAVTQNGNDVSFFSVSYPPLLNSEVYQESIAQKGNFLLIYILVLCLFSIMAFYLLVKRRKAINKKIPVHEHIIIEPLPLVQRKTNSAIYFFGGFQIYGNSEKNLTSLLSPTLIHLVIYLLLNSFKNDKGVSSGKLDETIWYDKSEESARNNRNVNLRKLRSVLENNIDIKIVNENTFWKIIIGKDVYCDLLEVQSLLGQVKMQHLNIIEVYRLLGILKFGEFLPNIQTTWCDKFKEAFIADIIATLEHLIDMPEVKADINLRYHIAECILCYDSLNEYAVAVKCFCLMKLGKPGLAKIVYDSFCLEYKNILGSVFSTDFNQLIKQE